MIVEAVASMEQAGEREAGLHERLIRHPCTESLFSKLRFKPGGIGRRKVFMLSLAHAHT